MIIALSVLAFWQSSATSDGSPAAGLLLIAIYLVPTVVAIARRPHNSTKIVLIDVLLGWTVVGWVIALLMALRAPTKAQQASAAEKRSAQIDAFLQADLKPCPAGGLVLRNGETCYYAGAAKEVKVVATRTYVGGYAGRRIGHTNWRLGGFAGRAITTERPKVVDTGTLYLTGARAVFIGKRTAEFKLEKIVNFEPFSDGLRVDVANKPYVVFVTGDAYAALTLGRLIEGAIKGVDPLALAAAKATHAGEAGAK